MEYSEKEIMLQKLADANRKLTIAQEQLDIANQKLTEYEEKAKKAEKASKMKSLFLANMSHEIRTPLNAIEGFSRVLVETDSQDDRMKFFEIIESNNNRLQSLVNEILDLSRVESGEIVMKKTSTDLNQLCDSIKNLFKFRCPETVKLSWEQPNMAVTFNTDANRITQVFSNLISNALKHTSSGSIKYGYRMLEEGTNIEFFVQDTGTGIAPDDLQHIFTTYVSRDAENSNNGALAMDFNYRLFNLVRIYTEFFLDDMESPISLVKNDNIEAKWAWMAGVQAGHDFKVKGHLLEVGTLAEYARVEPYVYSHFIKNTAQMAHLGYPLGNQGGPNSQTIDWNVYARLDKHIYASLRNTWFWKGTDYGSAVNDTTPHHNHMKIHKKFLDGAKMQYSLTPALAYEGQYVSFMGELTFIDDRKVYLRAGFKW